MAPIDLNKPLSNEDDYRAALAEVYSLMDAPLESPEGDRLEVLVTLIDAYEAIHWPISEPTAADWASLLDQD